MKLAYAVFRARGRLDVQELATLAKDVMRPLNLGRRLGRAEDLDELLLHDRVRPEATSDETWPHLRVAKQVVLQVLLKAARQQKDIKAAQTSAPWSASSSELSGRPCSSQRPVAERVSSVVVRQGEADLEAGGGDA